MDPLWRVELLGGLRLTADRCVVTHFETRKTAALLAYLAFHCGRPHPRDLLVELLWPEEDPEATRSRFRQTLAVLRRALEPPGIPAGGILIADRATVQLRPGAVVTDVAEFEPCVRLGTEAASL